MVGGCLQEKGRCCWVLKRSGCPVHFRPCYGRVPASVKGQSHPGWRMAGTAAWSQEKIATEYLDPFLEMCFPHLDLTRRRVPGEMAQGLWD
jgi:hypothetical protein